MIKKIKINDVVAFKAESLSTGIVVGVPDEYTNMYCVELPGGNAIRCTEHYITKSMNLEV